MSDKIGWIRELVLAEQEMEEKGLVDLDADLSPQDDLLEESIDFLHHLKSAFVEACTAFNQLKASTLGSVKIYGISKTRADFMLFRNGFKLIFSLQAPGEVAVYFNNIGQAYWSTRSESEKQTVEGDIFKAQRRPFGDLDWHFQGHPIKVDYLVRYYLKRFVRESS